MEEQLTPKEANYRKGIVSELAKDMKAEGYTVLGKKVLPIVVSAMVGLIIFLYGSLVSTDNAEAKETKRIDDRVTSIQVQWQNTAYNVYLLCADKKGVKCIKPEAIAQ